MVAVFWSSIYVNDAIATSLVHLKNEWFQVCEAAGPLPLLLSRLPAPSSSPPSEPRGKLSLFAQIGMSIPAPLTQVVVAARHIGPMISGVTSPAVCKSHRAPQRPMYLQARMGLSGSAIISTCFCFIISFIFLKLAVSTTGLLFLFLIFWILLKSFQIHLFGKIHDDAKVEPLRFSRCGSTFDICFIFNLKNWYWSLLFWCQQWLRSEGHQGIWLSGFDLWKLLTGNPTFKNYKLRCTFEIVHGITLFSKVKGML